MTAFAHVSVPLAELGAYLRAKAAGTLTARAALYFPLEDWRAVADTVATLGRGDDWVWIGGVKGYMDGSLGSTTALFYAAVRGRPRDLGRARDARGLAARLDRRRGLRRPPGGGPRHRRARQRPRCSTIYDSVARAHGPRDRRFRIEHAQHLRREDIARFARSSA